MYTEYSGIYVLVGIVSIVILTGLVINRKDTIESYSGFKMNNMTRTDEEKESKRFFALMVFIIFTTMIPHLSITLIYSIEYYDIFTSVFRAFVLLANLAVCFGSLYYYIKTREKKEGDG